MCRSRRRAQGSAKARVVAERMALAGRREPDAELLMVQRNRAGRVRVLGVKPNTAEEGSR